MPELTDVKGISDSRAETFIEEKGFTTVDDIATADIADIADIKGIGESTAEDIRESARDVIRDTVDDPDDGDEGEHSESPEPDVDTSVPDVEGDDADEFDVEAAEAEVETDTDADADATDEEGDGPAELTLDIDSGETYDYLHYSLMNIKTGAVVTRGRKSEGAQQLLDAMRGQGTGELTVELSDDELDGLHSGLKQTRLSYQGTDPEAYRVLDGIIDQVNEVRL